MAKGMTFEQKAKKQKKVITCPVCGGTVQHIRLVKSVRSESKGTWKFLDRHLGICKCNQAEAYK